MLKTVLVVLDGCDADHSAIDLAIRWAAGANALLVGLGIIDEALVHPAEAVPLGAGQAKLERDAARLQQQLQIVEKHLSAVALRCVNERVTFKPLECIGRPAEEIALEAQRFDLVVAPRQIPDGSDTPECRLSDALSAVLRAAPRPVIAVPSSARRGDAIVVAYDGSLQAARALHMFEGTGQAALRPVHVVSIDDDPLEAARRGERAIDFLAHHGIHATLRAETRTSHPAEQIMVFAEQLEAGLVVMGAYGQPRVREFVLGSVTRTLMAKCPIPLFLYH